jgi:hypothetical protein
MARRFAEAKDSAMVKARICSWFQGCAAGRAFRCRSLSRLPRRHRHRQGCHEPSRSGRPINWDDIRIILAVARAGQFLRAARKLGLCKEDHALVVGKQIRDLAPRCHVRFLILDVKGAEADQKRNIETAVEFM